MNIMDKNIEKKLTISAKEALNEITKDISNKILNEAYHIAQTKETAEKEISLSDILSASEKLFSEKIRQKNPILAEAAGQIINYVKQLGDDIDIIGRKQFISFKVKVNGRTRRFLVLDYTRKSRLLIYDGKYEELLGEIRGNTVPHELLDRIKKEYLKMKKRG